MKSHIAILFLLFSTFSSARAQYDVQIIPPDELTLAAKDLWSCIVTNGGNFTTDVFLHGTITEQEDGLILDINSSVFTLEPGTIVFNNLNYTLLTPEEVLYESPAYKDHFIRVGTLPRGIYTFCLELKLAGQLNTLATSCITVEVKTVTPPAVISPTYGDTICEVNPFFIWSPPQPPLTGADVSYQIYIYSITAGQTPEAAINNPAWYTESNISTPIYQYGFLGRPFLDGVGYAWYVEAFEDKNSVAVSDIGYFIWKNCLLATDTTTETAETSMRQFGVLYHALSGATAEQPVVVTESALHFSYIHELPAGEVYVQLLDYSGSVVTEKAVSMRPGYNFYSCNASEWNLIPGKHHTLLLMDQRGRVITLPFWYNPFQVSEQKK